MDPAGKVARYSLRIHSRACENAGAVDYTITETITEVPGGLRCETRSRGYSDGETFDQRGEATMWPGVTLEKAHAYRMAHGYVQLVD